MINGSKTLDVPADRDLVFARLVDLEGYPAWQSFVTGVEVRERDEHHRAVLVEARLDAKVTKLRTVLRYAYVLPDRVSWTRESGDLKDLTGSFSLAPSAAGTTRVTMTVTVDPGYRLGLLLRGPVEDRVRKRVLDGTLEGLAAGFRA